MRILNYEAEIKWRKGEEIFLADMISRADIKENNLTNDTKKVVQINYVSKKIKKQKHYHQYYQSSREQKRRPHIKTKEEEKMPNKITQKK